MANWSHGWGLCHVKSQTHLYSYRHILGLVVVMHVFPLKAPPNLLPYFANCNGW